MGLTQYACATFEFEPGEKLVRQSCSCLAQSKPRLRYYGPPSIINMSRNEVMYLLIMSNNATCTLCCCLMILDLWPRALWLEAVTGGLEPVSNVMLVVFSAAKHLKLARNHQQHWLIKFLAQGSFLLYPL